MKAIKLYFKRKKEDSIILENEEHKEIILPSEYIDFELQEGSYIYLKIQKSLIDAENKKELAVTVLEEILNGEE